jgi:hypothetical protein
MRETQSTAGLVVDGHQIHNQILVGRLLGIAESRTERIKMTTAGCKKPWKAMRLT